MNPIEVSLYHAIALDPALSMMLMSPSGGRLREWVSGDLARKLFTSIANLASNGKTVNPLGIISSGKFEPDEVKYVMKEWQEGKKSSPADFNLLLETLRDDHVVKESKSVVSEFLKQIDESPANVVNIIGRMQSMMSTLAQYGVKYDPDPTSHYNDKSSAAVGTWGNKLFDAMYDGGIPSRGYAMTIGPSGHGKCVVGSTLVTTEYGIFSIKELSDEREVGFHPLGIGVMTGRGMKTASHFYYAGVEPIKKLSTYYGYSLSGTHEHPVLSIENGSYIWKRLDEIKPGDYVAISRSGHDNSAQYVTMAESNHPKFKKISDSVPAFLDEETAYIYGALIGDGCLLNGNNIGFTNPDHEIVDRVRAWSEKIGVTMAVKSSTPKSRSYEYGIYGVALRDWLEINGLDKLYSYEKVVPQEIMSSPQSVIRSFIQGLFDTDGYSAEDGSIEYCTSSEEMAKQVHYLLASLGIISRMKYKHNLFHGAWLVWLHGDQARKFYEEIGFTVERKQAGTDRIAKKSNTNNDIVPTLPKMSWHDADTARAAGVNFNPSTRPSYRMANNLDSIGLFYGDPEILEDMYFWDKVSSCEDDGDQECFDICVPDGHEFIANSFVSHNSSLSRSQAAYLITQQVPVMICTNEDLIDAGETSRRLRNSLITMWVGERSDEDIDKDIKTYCQVYDLRAGANDITNIKQWMRWFQPTVTIVDSLDNMNYPPECAKMKDDQEKHRTRANYFASMTDNGFVSIVGNGSKAEQTEIIRDISKVNTVMAFGSVWYHNISSYSYVFRRDSVDTRFAQVKRCKNRGETGMIGNVYDMEYNSEGGYYHDQATPKVEMF